MRIEKALSFVALFAVLTISAQAGDSDFVRDGAATPPTIRASEDYPVSIIGGAPPAAVLGGLDADDSTYNRIYGAACANGLSGSGTAVYFDTITVTNTGAGPASVVFETSTQGDQTTCPFDMYATAYSTFDAGNPDLNCVATNDDDGVGACPLMSFDIPGGATYTIVVTSFTNGATGSWQANFDGTTPVELMSIAVE
jgi:hypothetical protein